MLKKTFSVIILVTSIWLTLGFIVFIGYPWFKAEREYEKEEFHGIITETRIREGHRGIPDVKLDSTWQSLKNPSDWNVVSLMKIGDSLAKGANRKILLFRKDGEGKWRSVKLD
jgi:hypothetical protein